MLSFAFYFLKVIICSGVLFGYYWFFLRNKVFHSYNRFYLLALIVISLAAPVIKINIWQKSDASKTSVIKMLQIVNSSDDYIDEIIINSQFNHISKESLFAIMYLVMSATFFFMFLRALLKIRNLLQKYSATVIENIFFIKTCAKGTPFSFLKYIFWNEAIDLDSKTGRQIFTHELVHVQEKHSYDKLFINMVLIFAWCNPFFWLVRKELNMIHEFIADKKAVENGDSSDFAAMILHATYPQFKLPLANNFFYSPIKRRLMMLTKQNKTKFNYLSRLIVLPIAIMVFAAFTIKAKIYTENASSAANKILTVVIDAGHGGKDKGAKASDGTYENDLCLAFANKIKAVNSNKNIKIILTRESDIYMSPKDKSAFAQKAGADLFISIHMATEELKDHNKHSGMEVYVAKDQYKNSEASKLFASAVIGSFQNSYGLRVPANPMQRQVGIWVLQDSQCPAVLIEAGYLSDKNDLAYLKTEKAVETFAKNVLAALNKYQMHDNSMPEQEPNKSNRPANDTTPHNKMTEKQLSLHLEQEKIALKNKHLVEQVKKSEASTEPKLIQEGDYRKQLESLEISQSLSALQKENVHQLNLLLMEKQMLAKQNIVQNKLTELEQAKMLQIEKELLITQNIENLKLLETLKTKSVIAKDTLQVKTEQGDK